MSSKITDEMIWDLCTKLPVMLVGCFCWWKCLGLMAAGNPIGYAAALLWCKLEVASWRNEK